MNTRFETVIRFLLIFICFLHLPLMAEVPVPILKSRVTDLTNTLNNEQINSLEEKLKSLETKKGSQVAVLIIPTTSGEPIEQFSFRVVEKWKLGRKTTNDGVLILVAKNDRKMRIEVGYGLEGVLPDAICKRIISEQMRPNFKAQKFHEGIESAVDSIVKLINGEALPAPTKSVSEAKGGLSNSLVPTIIGIVIMSVFIIGFGSGMTGFVTSTFGKLLGSGIFALAGAFLNMGFLGSENLPSFIIYLIGFFSFLFIFGLTFSASNSTGEGSSSGSWSSSSSDSWSSGSSSSSSSSSSDSFSGGGGDFGGGGASGDW